MNRIDHVRLLASYNEWMNTKVYEAAGRLREQDLFLDRKAFFGSIFGTLHHLVAGDTIWLKRFATHPSRPDALDPARAFADPVSLADAGFTDFFAMSAHRRTLDSVIVEWAASLTESNLDHVLHYSSMRGVPASKSLFGLLLHFFNHQTHHRGQATTLLFQAGIDVGVTDLLMLVPDE